MEDVKRDFLGNELKVGDDVVFMLIGYRDLRRGTIVKMTPKKCRIKHSQTSMYHMETLQFYNQVVKVPSNQTV